MAKGKPARNPTVSATQQQRLLRPALCALLVVMTLVAYLPAFDAGFIVIDDGDYVHGNEHITSGLTAENVRWAFTQSYAANWHPLTWINHMADVELFGLEPRGHHLANLAFHVANVVLLFLMLRSLTGQVAPSFVVAALFAIHPVNVESVMWISQRKTTLSTLFAILSIWSYARYARAKSKRAYAASLVCFALSLMAKQMMVTLPMALLLLDYWPLRRKEFDAVGENSPSLGTLVRGAWRLLPEKLPYLALVVIASGLTLMAQQGAMIPSESYSLAARFANATVAYVGYLCSLFWPLNLAVYYPLYPDDITPARLGGAAAILIAVTVACCLLGRRYRYLPVGWLWYLGTMVPVIGLVQVGSQAMADRYAYVPFWGLFIGLAWSANDWLARATHNKSKTVAPRHSSLRIAAGALLAVLCACLAWLTFQQARHWHDSNALFEDAIADTRRNFEATISLATLLSQQGQFPEATRRLEGILAAASAEHKGEPNLIVSRIRVQLGNVAIASGNCGVAIGHYRQALAQSPNNYTARNNLAWVLATSRDARCRDASQALTLAREARDQLRNPDHTALGTLAAAYAASGNMADAVRTAREALENAVRLDDRAAIAALREQLQVYEQGRPYVER